MTVSPGRRGERRASRGAGGLVGRALTAGVFTVSALLAASDAHAFCRTTTEMPANFRPDPDCFERGYLLFWRNACVGWDLHRPASEKIPYDVAEPLVEQAFKSWADATCAGGGRASIEPRNLGPVSCGNVDYDTVGPNHNVIVFREDGWPYSDASSTLGLTTVTFNPNTGEIYDADMEINVSTGTLSVSEQVPPNGYDFLSVVTHEAGHFLGLAHAAQPSSTMYPSYTQGSASLRDLAADDVEGICAIYPANGTRVVSPIVASSGIIEADACDPTPRHGFTAVCEGQAVTAGNDDGGGCAVAGHALVRDRAQDRDRSLGLAGLLGVGWVTVGLVRRRRSSVHS